MKRRMGTPLDVKVGDRMWIGLSTRPQLRLAFVERLTPTQIVLRGEASRFYRDGKPMNWNDEYLTAPVTPSDLEAFEHSQAKQHVERKEREDTQLAEEAKRTELHSLFGERNVTLSNHREGWELTFVALTEEQIRAIAESLSIERRCAMNAETIVRALRSIVQSIEENPPIQHHGDGSLECCAFCDLAAINGHEENCELALLRDALAQLEAAGKKKP
jgi:hypothetical protein